MHSCTKYINTPSTSAHIVWHVCRQRCQRTPIWGWAQLPSLPSRRTRGLCHILAATAVHSDKARTHARAHARTHLHLQFTPTHALKQHGQKHTNIHTPSFPLSLAPDTHLVIVRCACIMLHIHTWMVPGLKRPSMPRISSNPTVSASGCASGAVVLAVLVACASTQQRLNVA